MKEKEIINLSEDYLKLIRHSETFRNKIRQDYLVDLFCHQNNKVTLKSRI